MVTLLDNDLSHAMENLDADIDSLDRNRFVVAGVETAAAMVAKNLRLGGLGARSILDQCPSNLPLPLGDRLVSHSEVSGQGRGQTERKGLFFQAQRARSRNAPPAAAKKNWAVCEGRLQKKLTSMESGPSLPTLTNKCVVGSRVVARKIEIVIGPQISVKFCSNLT